MADVFIETLEDRTLLSPQLQFGFVETFGGTNQVHGGYYGEGRSVTTDLDGNVYVVSLRNETFEGSGTDTDVIVAKYSAEGTLTWQTNLRSGIGIDSGGIEDNPQFDRAVAVDTHGNVFVTGLFFGTVQFGSTTLTSSGGSLEDVFIAKINSSGELLETIQLGGTDADTVSGIEFGPDGNLYITGMFNGAVSFGSTILTSLTNDFGRQDADIFVAKLDDELNVLRAVRMGNGVTTLAGIGLDAEGDIYISGTFWSLYWRPDFGETVLKQCWDRRYLCCQAGL